MGQIRWSLLMGIYLLLSTVVSAEDMRVWSDNNGHTVEAKFIQVSGPKVVLEKTDGKRLMVPKNGLCMADQEYLAGVIPPVLKMKVDKDVDEEKLSEGGGYYSSYTRKRESVNIDVNIQKINKDKCTRNFTAQLYIVGQSKNGDRRKVIGHTDHAFSFDRSNSTSFSGSSSVTSSEYSGSYSGSEHGWEYEGYLVVVEDDKGSVIAIDTNKSTYESHLNKIKDNMSNKDGFKL